MVHGVGRFGHEKAKVGGSTQQLEAALGRESTRSTFWSAMGVAVGHATGRPASRSGGPKGAESKPRLNAYDFYIVQLHQIGYIIKRPWVEDWVLGMRHCGPFGGGRANAIAFKK
jgi:hypothetical protein